LPYPQRQASSVQSHPGSIRLDARPVCASIHRMTVDAVRDRKKAEELKRERNWDPVMRGKVIQDTITWAEA
jgi:hypothetical protein